YYRDLQIAGDLKDSSALASASISPVYILGIGDWSGASETRRSKAAVRGWTSRCAKRPSWYQSDETCRSVIGGTRPPARGCFAKPTHRDYTAPPDTRTQLSTTAWSATDLSACPLRGPDAKPTVDLQGRTV